MASKTCPLALVYNVLVNEFGHEGGVALWKILTIDPADTDVAMTGEIQLQSLS